MKKLYTLLSLLGVSLGFAQTPIITAIVDGPCPNGLPKVCEIYANGTVDFTQFSFQNQTNANTAWNASPLSLSALGTRTNEFVYIVYTNNNLTVATSEFPSILASNSIESGLMNLNGDDRVRIINTSTTAVIDQFGVSDIDGTGTTWEWLDTYAKRNNGTGPDGGFVEANWTIAPIDTLDTAGLCLTTPGPQLQTVVNLGNFTLSSSSFDAIDGLKMYPNPLKGDTLYLTSTANAAMSVQIFDVLGKEVLKSNVMNNAVNVSGLNAGVYIVKVTEEGKTATRKLVIQ